MVTVMLLLAPRVSPAAQFIEVPDYLSGGIVPAMYIATDPVESNGGFLAEGTYCNPWGYCAEVPESRLMLLSGAEVPDLVLLHVYLHELGHLDQHLRGVLHTRDKITEELEADEFAARHMCALGYDPTEILAAHRWFFVAEGYVGDRTHGSLAGRTATMERAMPPTCGTLETL